MRSVRKLELSDDLVDTVEKELGRAIDCVDELTRMLLKVDQLA